MSDSGSSREFERIPISKPVFHASLTSVMDDLVVRSSSTIAFRHWLGELVRVVDHGSFSKHTTAQKPGRMEVEQLVLRLGEFLAMDKSAFRSEIGRWLVMVAGLEEEFLVPVKLVVRTEIEGRSEERIVPVAVSR